MKDSLIDAGWLQGALFLLGHFAAVTQDSFTFYGYKKEDQNNINSKLPYQHMAEARLSKLLLYQIVSRSLTLMTKRLQIKHILDF